MGTQDDWIGQPTTVAGAANVAAARKAAEAVPLNRSQRIVYQAVKAQGHHGATSSEVAASLECLRDAVSPRFVELRDKGLVMVVPGNREGQKIWRAVYL